MEENKLKKALTAAGIWSVAVGAVISGSYYGWNYIASETNFTGCLIAMAIATLFYIPFAFMFAELATAIPSSAGPAAYTEKAFGRGAGFFAGFSYLVESLFCTPGICIAVGAYVHTLFPVVPAVVASVVASACPASSASSIRTAPRSTHFSLPPSSASSLPSSARLTLSLLSQTWVPHSWLFAASSPGSSSQRISRICLAPTSAPVGSATSAFPSALSLRSARCTAQ